MMRKKDGSSRNEESEFFKAILKLKTEEECRDFFEDMCAAGELRFMEQRYEVAKMLREGKVYVEISAKTNASTATISRVKRMMESGTGCISTVLSRMDEK